MSAHQSLAKSSLAYAKLTAIPTDTAWSQVYNAGNLFACLSLTLTTPQENPTTLQNIGKELFNNLEAEFFTLEEKNRETITEAITKSTKDIPEHVTLNFCLAYFKENILYLFLQGQGCVMMKRQEKIGILIERTSEKEQTREIHTASGYLQNGDTIIIESPQFAQTVSDHHVQEALQLSLPNDIADSLSIHMHEHPDGAQAAIIIVYHTSAAPFPIETKEATLADITETENPSLTSTVAQQEQLQPHRSSNYAPKNILHSVASSFKNPLRGLHLSHNKSPLMMLTHRKKLFLSITVVILLLLITSIIFTKQKQDQEKNTALFASLYTPALKNYEEGKALASLNKTVSQEELLEAEKLLKEGQGKFAENSKEAKQIGELLAKIQQELHQEESPINTVNTKEVTLTETDLLALEKKTVDGLGFSQNNTSVYYVTPQAAFSVTKSSGKTTELFANDNDWKKAVAIVPYQSNLYILDQQNGVLKFVPSGDSFTKANYFPSNPPNLTKAISMAIDSSIWILFADGEIKKYTKGQQDTFSMKGLTKPLTRPTKIYTDPEINNVYILDTGNSRIVQLNGEGAFQKEIVHTLISKAKDFEVFEKDKKIVILADNKFWELPL